MIHSKIFRAVALRLKRWTQHPFCSVCRRDMAVTADSPWIVPGVWPQWIEWLVGHGR